MKSNLTNVSLVLLSAVFILGCQDQGSGPVGPDGLVPQFAKVKNCDPPDPHPSCKEEGGTGGSVPANLTMTSGMTASAQTVEFQDRENILAFSNFVHQPITLAMALSATHNDLRDECTPFLRNRATPDGDDLDDLFDKLIDPSQVRDGGFFVRIDKNALGESDEHSIQVVWEDVDGSFDVSVGSHSRSDAGASSVTLAGDLSTGDVTVTFTGGSIRLRNKTGSVPEHFNLTCPILAGDVISMVLTAT